MADLLTAIGSVVTEVVTWVGSILELFTTDTILQLMLGLMIAGWVLRQIFRVVVRR